MLWLRNDEDSRIVSKADTIGLQVFDPGTLAPIQDAKHGVLDEELAEGGLCVSYVRIDPANRDLFSYMLRIGATKCSGYKEVDRILGRSKSSSILPTHPLRMFMARA